MIEKTAVTLLAAGVLAFWAAGASAADVDVSFRPDAWSLGDWIVIKSPRWDYKHGFVQKADCIENECPDVSGEEIFRKHNSKVYSATKK